jgi:hypothetical protein
MNARRLAVVLFLLALCFSGAAVQASPRITLKLEGATLHDALLQLRQATGWDLRGPSGEGSELYEPGEKDPKASFNWKEASLGKVCRDLGEAFRCVPQSAQQNSIRFETRPGAGARPLVASTREGVTFIAGSVSLVHSLELSGPKPQAKSACEIKLLLRPSDGDPGGFYGLDKVRGVDNLGKPVRWDRTDMLRPEPGAKGRPDEWAVDATLTGMDPRARQLAFLEGQLVLYREAQNVRVEMPLAPPLSLPFRRAAGPVELTVFQAQQVSPNNVQLRMEASWPTEVEVSTTSHNNVGWPYPAVRLASGRISRMGGSANAGLADNKRRVALSCAFEGNMGDPPIAIVWDFMVRSQADRRIPFRLERIPLVADVSAAPGPPGTRPGAPEPPASGPGTLVSTVLFGDQPAGEGELGIGLSRKRADGAWDAVRWKVLDTDDGGTATLDGVAPGTYKVLRKFRPRDPGRAAPASSHWLNDTVEVKVDPGKTVTLPPLKRVP